MPKLFWMLSCLLDVEIILLTLNIPSSDIGTSSLGVLVVSATATFWTKIQARVCSSLKSSSSGDVGQFNSVYCVYRMSLLGFWTRWAFLNWCLNTVDNMKSFILLSYEFLTQKSSSFLFVSPSCKLFDPTGKHFFILTNQKYTVNHSWHFKMSAEEAHV